MFVSFGGEEGIRTLERVLAVTRFPVVRLRPAQPPLHLYQAGQRKLLYHFSPAMSRKIFSFSKKINQTNRLQSRSYKNDDK